MLYIIIIFSIFLRLNVDINIKNNDVIGSWFDSVDGSELVIVSINNVDVFDDYGWIVNGNFWKFFIIILRIYFFFIFCLKYF